MGSINKYYLHCNMNSKKDQPQQLCISNFYPGK